MVTKMTEQELAQLVITWLEERDWEVYQEVCSGANSQVADIVATKPGQTWIIECKQNYGLAVLNQACYWIQSRAANYVSVATKHTKKRKGSASRFFHKDKGVGLMTVRPNGQIKVLYEPSYVAIDKDSYSSVSRVLCEEQKHMAKAGSATGGHFTPFKKTVKEAEDYIRENPGTTLKEMISHLGKMHYANEQSAKSSFNTYIRKGIIDSIGVQQNGKRQELYLKEQTDDSE